MSSRNKHKTLLSAIGKYFFVSLFMVIISFSPMGAKKSDAWDAIIGATYHRMLDTIYDNIKGAVLAALKQAAAKTINDLVGKLVTGSSPSSTKFIYDWQDYLKDQPKKTADSYLNDYLSKVTAGMASSNFVSSEGFKLSNGISSSYVKNLTDVAKSTTSSYDPSNFSLDYMSDPSKMFDSGNLSDFTNYTFSDSNTYAFEINTNDVWNAKKSSEEKIASDQGIAYNGYKATIDKSGNYVITPGSNTKDAVSNAQDIGNKALSAANTAMEVIVSVVTQILTKAITQGIGNIQSIVSQAISGEATSSVSDALTSAVTGAVSDTANSLGSSVVTGIGNSITNSASGSATSSGSGSSQAAGSLGQFWQSQGLPTPTQ